MLTLPLVLPWLMTRGWREWVPGNRPASHRQAGTQDQREHSGYVLPELAFSNLLICPCLILFSMTFFFPPVDKTLVYCNPLTVGNLVIPTFVCSLLLIKCHTGQPYTWAVEFGEPSCLASIPKGSKSTMNTITSFSPFLYNAYSLWYYIIHQPSWSLWLWIQRDPDDQLPLDTSYLISSMKLYTTVFSACKMQPVIPSLQGYCET